MDFDRATQNLKVGAVVDPGLNHRPAHDVSRPQRRLIAADSVLDAQRRLDNAPRPQYLHGGQVTVIELPTRFERDGGAGHLSQVRQQKFQALAAMSSIAGVCVDVHHDEPGQRKAGNRRDELAAPFVEQ